MTSSQRVGLRTLLTHRNSYLSGVAGTGKSYLLRSFVELCHLRDRQVAITASAGLPASLIGGQTIHSWSGAGRGDVDPDRMPARWHSTRSPVIRATDVLVLDEVSMLDARTLAVIEGLCRAARDPAQAWGGLQVVFVGDMGQLPPVEEAERGFAFESFGWQAANPVVVELSEVVRQSEATFVQALFEARMGKLSAASLRLLSSRVHAYDPEVSGVLRLTTHRRQAEKINLTRLAKLEAQGARRVTFRARDTFAEGVPPQYLEGRLRLRREVALAPGARVLFVQNDSGGRWVNGSQGTVLELFEEAALVLVDGADAPVVVERSLNEVCDRQVEHSSACEGRRRGCRCPIDRKLIAVRYQIPLDLGWSATVHRSQGMTLDAVSVDLRKTFASGQSYVAVSRARTLSGLNIEGWRGAASFWLHPRVEAFLAGRSAAQSNDPTTRPLGE